MNRPIIAASFALTLLLTFLLAPAIKAQGPADGCSLTSWILHQSAHSTLTPELPAEQYDTTLLVNGTSQTLHLQRGFKIGIFARISACRGLALSPDGVIYATSYGGSITALPDHNHLGRPDSMITIITGKASVHGIGFLNGTLYFSNQTELDQVTATNADRSVKSVKTLLSGFNTSDHITHTFVFDTLRKKIYMQVGSSCNYCKTTDSTLATIMEYNYDASGARIYARGLRNAVGLDLDPRTNALWTNVNGMDDLFGRSSPLHNSIPPEGVFLVCNGANYGWPYAYGFRMRNPDPAFQIDTSYIEQLSGPVAEVLAHSAPLGLHFYRGSSFPTKYHNAIFMAYHGSWNADPPSPPRVTVLWADQDGKNAKVQDFLTGFQLANGTRWGRTVEVIEGADSALYISDDNAAVIYRVTYAPQTGAVGATYRTSGQNLSLNGVSPNPFSRTTTLHYTLQSAATVQIDLVDLLGRTVKTFTNGMIGQGNHEVQIDHTGLSTGAYFIRAAAGSEIRTARIELVE